MRVQASECCYSVSIGGGGGGGNRVSEAVYRGCFLLRSSVKTETRCATNLS